MMTHADILDSTHGSELLAFLLLAPPRSYSAKELAKRLHISEKTLSKLLDEFLEDSMLKQFTRDRVRLYIVNQKHKLLPEIRASLVKNQKPYEDEFFTAIGKLGEVKAAFLSGALTGKPELPVDLLLVGKANLTKLEIFLKNCRTMLGIDLNYSVMTPDEFQLRRDTFDRFIKDVFDYPHIVVFDNLHKGKKK
jgi:DNA-binding Lrp family transcriptional regulator